MRNDTKVQKLLTVSGVGPVTFDFVTFGDLPHLAFRHPIVLNLGRNPHQPPSSSGLASCPDISEDFPVYFYLSINGEIITSFTTRPDVLFVGQNKYRWAWAGGLLTDPSYREKGLGKLIISESTSLLRGMDIGWGGVFSTAVALHIYEKLGFSIPGFASRYVLLKKAYPILKRRVKFRILAHSCDTIYRVLFRLYRPILSRMTDIKGNRITELDLHQDPQTVLLTPLHHEPYHFNDDNEKLRWKLADRKNIRLFLVQDRQEQLKAYLIIKERSSEKTLLNGYGRFRLMTLMDFGAFSSADNVYESIMNSLIYLFLRSNAEILEIISSSPRLNFYARRRGMLKLGKGMSFSFSVPSHWRLGESAKDPANWPLTHFCGDAYSFA